MKYIVNTNLLDTEAVAAIICALERHYGEPCLERIASLVQEESFDINLIMGDDSDVDETCLVRAVEED